MYNGTSLGLGSALREKGEEKSASKACRKVVWGEERVTKSLMPSIRPPVISLSLKCQQVKFSLCRFCKQIFDSR